jgi:hypothetical protein
MRKLAFILLLSTLSMGTTFSQCEPLSWLDIIDEPANGYVMGCDIIEFKWSIEDGLFPNGIILPIDAQVAYYQHMYERVDIVWNDSAKYGVPDHIIEFDTVENWGIVEEIQVNDYGEGKPALGTVYLIPKLPVTGSDSKIIHNSRFSHEQDWRSCDNQVWNIAITGAILSGNVSDLIDSNIIVSQGAACSDKRPLQYYIESDLTVDVDYCFRSHLNSTANSDVSDIRLAPNANIIVNEGITLTLDDVLVHNCDGTWGSIILKEGATLEVNKSKIQNAKLAIDQEGGTDVNIIDSDIEACENGIRSVGGRTLFIENSTITNTAASGRGKIAVELEDHKNASITESHIEHFEDGIIGRNTNVQFSLSSIHDMEAGSYGDGIGIDLEGSGHQMFSAIEGDRNSGTGRVNFKDCNIGVNIIRQRVHIESNVMDELDVGISMNNTFIHRQMILDNSIKARDYGIYLNKNPGAIGEIADNEIRIIAGGLTAQASCIRMDDTGPGWKLKQNSFFIEEGTYGVRSGHNYVPRLLDNYFQVPNDRGAYGVFAGHDVSPKLQCNSATSTSSLFSTTGFFLDGASNYLASCNTSSGLHYGFYFDGHNTGMDKLQGNDLGGTYGLVVGANGSRCDMQFNRGNCFDNSDARMIDNTEQAGLNSQIRFNNDPQNGGNTCFEPGTIEGPGNWFEPRIDSEYDCASSQVSCDAPSGAPSGGVCDSESYIHTIDSPRVWTYNQEAQQMYAELAIYHTLRLANCPSPAPTLDSLLIAHQGDVWDAYVSYEEAMAEIPEIQLEHDSVILVNQWDRMMWFDSLGTLFSDTSYYDSSAVQGVLGQIAQCDSVIQARGLIIATDKVYFIGSLDSILNAPTPSNLHETRLVNVLKIHLEVYKEDSTIIDLSASDSMYLDSIAMLCIYESGKAGAIARTILSYFRPDEQYNDDTLCVPLQYLARPGTDDITEKQEALVQQTMEDASQIQISPNPTTGDWHIEVLNGSQGYIRVMDLRGRVVSDMEINGLSARVPATGLPGGMYLLQWTDAKGNVEVHKLYVQ